MNNTSNYTLKIKVPKGFSQQCNRFEEPFLFFKVIKITFPQKRTICGMESFYGC